MNMGCARVDAEVRAGSVVYVGGFSFPDGDAGGLRVLGVGRALQHAGCNVTFVGEGRGGRPQDRLPSGGYCYDGFTYVPEVHHTDTPLSRAKRVAMSQATAQTTMHRLSAMTLSPGSAIIAYGATAPLLWRLRGFCRKRGVALLADCVEWYDPRHVPLGRFGPFRWNSELRMRWLHPKVGRIIVISSFLADYYRRRSCHVLRVPPLVDTYDEALGTPFRPDDDSTIRLAYAGSPGKKDLLANAVRGLHRMGPSRSRVELHLVGVETEALARLLGDDATMLGELGDRVVCHGRLPHAAATRVVSASDFSILLRSNERYAHAGFPSKLVESLSLGVPVLTNLTGDIGEYVRDGQEGVVLEAGSAEAFEAGVRKVVDLTRDARLAMREHALSAARRCFDYRNYARSVRDFVDEAVNSCRPY